MAKVTFLGHAGVEIQAGGHSVLIDPFLTNNPAAKHKPTDFKPSAILLSHGHFDHVGDSVDIARRANCPLVAIFELASFCQERGAPKVVGMNMGGPTALDFGEVTFTPAFHSSGHEGRYLGEACGILLRTKDGKVIYHSGDTALFSDMALIGRVGLDLALLPIGSYYTMDPAAALEAVKLLKPKLVVPIHYNTFPAINQDGAAFARQVAGHTSARAVVLKPGESHEF